MVYGWHLGCHLIQWDFQTILYANNGGDADDDDNDGQGDSGWWDF